MLRQYIKKALRYFKSNNYKPLNRIELDHSRMLGNIAYIQQQHPQLEVIPVLKGNAYGHGITTVAEILKDVNCSLVAVDGYFEASKVRDITLHRILVMGYILPVNVRLLDVKRCSFVVQDIQGLRALGTLGKSVRIHLELNTGMNRLGLQPSELSTYLSALRSHPTLELEGVMTHLADADNGLDEAYTIKQAALFDEQVSRIIDVGFKPKFIHIAQTAGSAKIKSRYANAIRLGIGIYGINPLASHDPHHKDLDALQPVLELKSTIIKVLDINKGDKVGYNCTFTALEPMRIGILPIGYYEGVPRELSNKGCVTYKGYRLPIIGRICMDHMIIDLKDSGVQVNQEVTIISKDSFEPNSIVNLQARHGLFSYSTLTGLSSTIRRKIV